MISTTKVRLLVLLTCGALVIPGIAYGLDGDMDGIEDAIDNCPLDANNSQVDLDGDNVGDACDTDRDGDGLTNAFETGFLSTDPDRWDTDGDSISDFYDCKPLNPDESIADDCDTVIGSPPGPGGSGSPNPLGDEDGDEVVNQDDNCPFVYNPSQADQDDDDIGDLCDPSTAITPPLNVIEGVLNGGAAGGCSLIPR